MNRNIISSAKPIFTQWRIFKLSEKEKYGNSFFREFATLYPEIIAAGMFAVSAAAYSAYVYKKRGAEHYSNKPFKHVLTIVRPDDPEVERLKYYCHMYKMLIKGPASETSIVKHNKLKCEELLNLQA
ncbi:unnamed protein product [Lepeophtheirus salmonis]|uniref:(salmon louse) hypothetical protein n=1 Tax=Lepeophtheirus salmonis TaxID=72036 RepID=A0A7R8CFM9_LEPSM|nr:unnamed protein product [Lepeophtheirus salmonis]CAF2808005.1 unnamed protein product [Lepeophtheirus salmonis]